MVGSSISVNQRKWVEVGREGREVGRVGSPSPPPLTPQIADEKVPTTRKTENLPHVQMDGGSQNFLLVTVLQT
jgi:hypothetical protein